jgi:hypothetical protein
LLATHLIGIPFSIAHELEAFVRDVLGDAGDEVSGAKHFKVALNLGVHLRAVNDFSEARQVVRCWHLDRISASRWSAAFKA